MQLDERFWLQVDKSGDHWLWTGRTDKDGYPVVHALGETRGHRVAFLLQFGAIPDGHDVDHECLVRACVLHLRAIPAAMNRAQTARSLKPLCIRGHARIPENLRVERDGRKCIPCSNYRRRARLVSDPAYAARRRKYHREYQARWRAAKKAALGVAA